MVNINKLRGKIVECGSSIDQLAKQMGIDRSTLYRRLAGNGSDFTIEEADAICVALQLTLDEANKIFFTQFVA